MAPPLKIDFVSDVTCPWCAIGFAELERALARLGPDVAVDLEVQPFELNPGLDAGGVDATDHLRQKLGVTDAALRAANAQLEARGRAAGFTFDFARRQRIYNTRAAHRLLYWARTAGGDQRALKRDLLAAYFGRGADLSSTAVLTDLAAGAGLDRGQAQVVLAGEAFGAEVEAREQFFQEQGIAAVPSVIIARRYLVQGGQTSDVFEQVLRRAMAT